jgi:hypothetical protein
VLMVRIGLRASRPWISIARALSREFSRNYMNRLLIAPQGHLVQQTRSCACCLPSDDALSQAVWLGSRDIEHLSYDSVSLARLPCGRRPRGSQRFLGGLIRQSREVRR